MTEENNIPTVEQAQQNQLPPYKIAFVIDGEVVDILHTDERLAAIFLSSPILVDVTNIMTENPAAIMIGDLYDKDINQFSKPEIKAEQEE